MEKINLIEMVQEVLDSNETAYSLSKKSGISEQLIGKYRNGVTSVGNMTIENAQKLINIDLAEPERKDGNRVFASLLAAPVLQRFGYDADFICKNRLSLEWGEYTPFLDYFLACFDDMNNISIIMRFEDTEDTETFEEIL